MLHRCPVNCRLACPPACLCFCALRTRTQRHRIAEPFPSLSRQLTTQRNTTHTLFFIRTHSFTATHTLSLHFSFSPTSVPFSQFHHHHANIHHHLVQRTLRLVRRSRTRLVLRSTRVIRQLAPPCSCCSSRCRRHGLVAACKEGRGPLGLQRGRGVCPV